MITNASVFTPKGGKPMTQPAILEITSIGLSVISNNDVWKSI